MDYWLMMNNSEFTDPETFIAGVTPGKAIFSRWSEDNINFETGFFIQEDRKHLNKLSKYPKINLRSGLIIYLEKIGVIPIMWKINYDYELLYETTLNVHLSDGLGLEYLNDLCSQDRILFHFYEGRERKRSIMIENKMKSEFEKIKAAVEKLPAWTMKDFDWAKERLFQDFTTPTKLFNALESDKNFYLFN